MPLYFIVFKGYIIIGIAVIFL